MEARGKREARRPWYGIQTFPALKGRNARLFRSFRPCSSCCL